MHPVTFISLFIFSLFLLPVFSVQAVDTPPDTKDEATEEYKENIFTWESSKPTVTDFDWVQLTSGEWLKGELISMYEDSVEFDSDEFDEDEDW